MNSSNIKRHTALYRIPPFLLVCLFAICTLLVASYGLDTYLSIQQMTDRNYVGRTGVSYIATKIRQMGDAKEIRIDEPNTLVLVEESDGELYETRIYYEDGKIKEAFVSAGYQDELDAMDIVEAKDFRLEFVSDNLLRFTIVGKDGKEYQMTSLVRAKEVKAQ